MSCVVNAQVDYVEPSQNMIHLKLLPRVDYTRHRGALRTQNVCCFLWHFSRSSVIFLVRIFVVKIY